MTNTDRFHTNWAFYVQSEPGGKRHTMGALKYSSLKDDAMNRARAMFTTFGLGASHYAAVWFGGVESDYPEASFEIEVSHFEGILSPSNFSEYSRNGAATGPLYRNSTRRGVQWTINKAGHSAKEIVRKWVADLRSGVFVQARGRLAVATADGCTFCCLGVLSRDNIPGWDKATSSSNPMEARFHNGVMDIVVNALYGIPQESTLARNTRLNLNVQTHLTTYNDALGFNFNQIADCIEWALDYGWLP